MPGVTISISVIIPTHERPETCALAVRSALNQSRPPREVIVSCDGCSPDAVRVLREIDGPVRVLDLPKGLGYGYANRNEALEQAESEVIAWLADDDLYLPDHLERIGEVHDTGDVEIVQATCCHVRANGFIEAMSDDWNHPFVREQLLAGKRVGSTMSAISHRRESAFRVGGWNAEMEAGADIDLWRRMAEVTRAVTLAGPTVLHLRNTGRNQPPAERIAQNRALFARINDPEELARLRAEMGHAVYRRFADHQQEAHHLRLEVESLRDQLEAATEEAPRQPRSRLRRARSAVSRRLIRGRG
jgi:glycosyltransferase involved in cell wall biosynthesis